MNLKEYAYIALIVLVSFLVRFFWFFKVMNKPEYHFIGTSYPYFFDPDSFHYFSLLGLPYWVVVVEFFVITILAVLVFYACLRRLGVEKETASIGAMVFSVCPAVFRQTWIGYIDTNGLILLLFGLMILGAILIAEKKYLLSICLLFGSAAGLMLTWLPGSLILISFFITAAVAINKRKIILFTVGLVGALSFIATTYFVSPHNATNTISAIKGIFSLKALGVAEYAYLVDPTVYLIYFIAVGAWFFYPRPTKIENFLYILGGMLAIGSFFFGRVAVFAIIPLLLVSVVRLQERKQWALITKVLLPVSIILAIFYYGAQVPEVNRSYELALRNSNIQINDTVLTFWDQGHYVKYFTGAKVPFKAQPSLKNNEIFGMGLCVEETDAVTYFDNVSNDYFIFLSSHDFEKVLCSGFHENTIPLKLQRHESLDHFTWISYGDQEIKYYVLERKTEG